MRAQCKHFRPADTASLILPSLAASEQGASELFSRTWYFILATLRGFRAPFRAA